LERWFNAHSCADYIHPTSRDVTDLIVTFDGKSSMLTAKCMFNIKGMATRTMTWRMTWSPSVSQADGITELSLVKGKTMLLNRHN
jgi:hypothetical protein